MLRTLESMKKINVPMMKTYLELQIPNIYINPNLDEIQASFTHVLANTLETHRAIVMWGQRDDRRASQYESRVKFGGDENGRTCNSQS